MYSGTQISFSCPPQHWIANNLFGLAFSLNGVELLHLNNVSTGCILLGGLFIYDVFWVSGSILQAIGGSMCLAFCLSGGTTLAGHTLEVRIFTFSAQRGVAGLMTESTVAECGSSSASSFVVSLREPRTGRDLIRAIVGYLVCVISGPVFPTMVFPRPDSCWVGRKLLWGTLSLLV